LRVDSFTSCCHLKTSKNKRPTTGMFLR
jgi:hypothetical protein